MNSLKSYIRQRPGIYKFCLFVFYMTRPLFPRGIFRNLIRYLKFCKHLVRYSTMKGSEPFRLFNLRPCLEDWTKETPVDRYYFYQDTWAAEKIIRNTPEFHVDIGSTVLFVGILSKITRICSIDIRPLPLTLKDMEFKKGSILELPFEDGQIHSLSSLCVIEHVGLGRYGDSLDTLGTYKAAKELSRVIGKGGNLYVSVPVGENSLYFNAYRSFDPEDFITMFNDFKLIDTLFILDDSLCTLDEFIKMDRPRDISRMTIGCFHFQKV